MLFRTGGWARFSNIAVRAAGLAFDVFSSAAIPADRQDQPMPEGRGGRIVGGEISPEGAWPWQIALFAPSRSGILGATCGGSLIAPQWAVTAAHCVNANPSGAYSIGYGSNRLSGLNRIDVEKVIIHESYDPSRNDNDIALLKLARAAPLPPGKFAHLPPLTRSVQQIQPGENVTVSGFGFLNDCRGKPGPGCTMQDQLRDVTLSAMAMDECRRVYAQNGQALTEHQLCVGYSQGGKDSCQGDSGGPLVVKRGDIWVQFGVVSWGAGCAQPGLPGVYTNVAAYVDWIIRNAGPVTAENPVASAAGPAASSSAIASRIVSVRAVGDPFRVGGRARFEVQSSVAGYLLIFDVNPEGKLTQLFPNRFGGAGGTLRQIKAGETIRFPNEADRFEIKVTQPPGEGLVVAVVTKNDVGVAELVGRYGSLEPVKDFPQFFGRLEVVVKSSPPINPLNGNGTWTMGEAHYHVSE